MRYANYRVLHIIKSDQHEAAVYEAAYTRRPMTLLGYCASACHAPLSDGVAVTRPMGDRRIITFTFPNNEIDTR